MIKRLVAGWTIWQANRIARSIVRPIRVQLLCVKDENGKLNPLIPEDDFVLTYIYGMVMADLEVLGKEKDHWISAYTLRLSFDHLFGRGRELAERCLKLAEENDDDF